MQILIPAKGSAHTPRRELKFQAITVRAKAPGTYYYELGARLNVEYASAILKNQANAAALGTLLMMRDLPLAMLQPAVTTQGLIRPSDRRLTMETYITAIAAIANGSSPHRPAAFDAYLKAPQAARDVYDLIFCDLLISAGLMVAPIPSRRPDPRPDLFLTLEDVYNELERVEIETILGGLNTNISIDKNVTLAVLGAAVSDIMIDASRALLRVGYARRQAEITFAALRHHVLLNVPSAVETLQSLTLPQTAVLDQLAANLTYVQLALTASTSRFIKDVYALEKAIDATALALTTTPRFQTMTRDEFVNRFSFERVLDAQGDLTAALLTPLYDHKTDPRAFIATEIYPAARMNLVGAVPYVSEDVADLAAPLAGFRAIERAHQAVVAVLHRASGHPAVNFTNVKDVGRSRRGATAALLTHSMTLLEAFSQAGKAPVDVLTLYLLMRLGSGHLRSDGASTDLWAYSVQQVSSYQPMAMVYQAASITTDTVDALLALEAHIGTGAWELSSIVPCTAEPSRFVISQRQVDRLIPAVKGTALESGTISLDYPFDYDTKGVAQDALTASITPWEFWRRTMPADLRRGGTETIQQQALDTLQLFEYAVSLSKVLGGAHLHMVGADILSAFESTLHHPLLRELRAALLSRALEGRSFSNASEALELEAMVTRDSKNAVIALKFMFDLMSICGYAPTTPQGALASFDSRWQELFTDTHFIELSILRDAKSGVERV